MCAIDMGSNSFRRIVGSFEGGRYEQRGIDVVTLGVGDDVARYGRIRDDKLAEIQRTLARFKAACDADGVARTVAIGTAAFRQAPNGRRAVDVAAGLGIAMEIASETREAELAYLVGSLGRPGYAVVDNGSRSIELVAHESGALRSVVFNLGYRVAYEQFFASAGNAAEAARAFAVRVRAEVAKAPFMKGKRKLVGIEFREMADAFFPPAPTEGRVLSLAGLRDELRRITSLERDAFEALKKRKDIDRALPRLIVAISVMEAFGYSQLQLTDRELGAGLIIEAGANSDGRRSGGN